MNPDPFQMLFTAKWNVPQASAAMGRTPCMESWELTKAEFREYCKTRPETSGFTGQLSLL
jgi:hypothetical protein